MRIAVSAAIVQGGAAHQRYRPAMFKRRKATKPDFFRDSVKERRAAEDEQPWFLAEDEAPDLEVEAGRSPRPWRPRTSPRRDPRRRLVGLGVAGLAAVLALPWSIRSDAPERAPPPRPRRR